MPVLVYKAINSAVPQNKGTNKPGYDPYKLGLSKVSPTVVAWGAHIVCNAA